MTIQTPDMSHVTYRQAQIFINDTQVEYNKSFIKVRAEYEAGDKKRLRSRTHDFLRNSEVKVYALYRAKYRNPSEVGYRYEAKALDLFTPFTRPVNWKTRKKNKQGFRVTCDLPYDLKAAHYMIADLIAAQMPQQSFIHNIGYHKGRNRLAQKIVNNLNAGFTSVRTYDVRNCFQNVNPQALYNLPLPERIINHALIIENLTMQRVATRSEHFTDTPYRDIVSINNVCNTDGPTGIMQGSTSSNQILAYLLQGMPQLEAAMGSIDAYGDDVISMARRDVDLESFDKSLIDYFGQSQLGPFELQMREAVNGGYFEFLGYGFQKELNGTWAIVISQYNLGRFDERHRAAIRRDYSEGFRFPHHSRVNIENALNGFQAITDKEAFRRDNIVIAYEYLSQSELDFGLGRRIKRPPPTSPARTVNIT
jgi:hypothetical protein